MPTNRLIRLRYLRDSVRFSVGEDSSFRRAEFRNDYMYIAIRWQLSTNQEGKYACIRNLPPLLFPTHLVPSYCLYPFGRANFMLLDSIDPLDSTRLPRLHRWIPYSPYTTQLRRVHRVPRSLTESVAYCTAPTAQLHSSDTTQRRRVRRVLHNFVEFILLYTTEKREVSSKGNGRRPGEEGKCDWRKQNGRKGGTFFRDLLVHLTREEALHRVARDTQSGKAGGSPQGGQVGWGPQGGAGRDAAGPANPVRAGSGHNQKSPPSLPSPFGIGGRWGPQATREDHHRTLYSEEDLRRRHRWRQGRRSNNSQGMLANNSEGLLANNSQGSLANNSHGLLANSSQGLLVNSSQGSLANSSQGMLVNSSQGVLVDSN